MNNLRRRLAGDGKVQFILHGGEKLFGDFLIWIIVSTALGVNVSDFLIKPPLTGANIANAGKLLFKVVSAKNLPRIFQSLIIHGKALDDVLFEDLCGPYSEMRGLLGVYPITHGNNGIEVVKLDRIRLCLSINGPMLSGMFQNGTHHFLI